VNRNWWARVEPTFECPCKTVQSIAWSKEYRDEPEIKWVCEEKDLYIMNAKLKS